jgi:hypothetical protein
MHMQGPFQMLIFSESCIELECAPCHDKRVWNSKRSCCRRALQEAEVAHKQSDTLPQAAANAAGQAAADAHGNINGQVGEGSRPAMAEDIDAVRQARRERALQAQHMHEAEAAAAETSSEEESVCHLFITATSRLLTRLVAVTMHAAAK